MNSTTESPRIVIKPRIRGFICVTAHPTGCAANVQEQINYVTKQGPIAAMPKRILVIGASTGYGLASRIVSAFAGKANSIGVFFEKPSEGGKPATAGWYNSLAFAREAKKQGLYAENINGDAFSDEIKQQVIEAIKKEMKQVDVVIYSLASPKRVHPKTKTVYSSALKPVGATFTAKTLDTDKELVKEITIEPANEQEVADTTAVMGGEDWSMWIDQLKEAGVLADNALTVAYSYIGPKVTWPIYRDGTIGIAKADLEKTAEQINKSHKDSGVQAYVSINKALVTQASSAIPVVPLYVSLLYKVMKEKHTHEGCIEQMYRLFAKSLFTGKVPALDAEGRIRVDDLEMEDSVQKEIEVLWPKVTTENLKELSDYDSYRKEFLRLFGFGLAGVDYEAEVDPSQV